MIEDVAFLLGFLKVPYNNPWFVYHLNKGTWDLVYPDDFRNTREIKEFNRLAEVGDWKLKNTDFSRKIKTPGLVYK